MKAAIFDPENQAKDGDRSVLEVHDIDVRDPEPSEVLVRTTTSGVCHSDLHFIDGKWAAAFGGLPAVLGHEAAGVVESVGDDVTYVRPGDNVIMSFRPFCGECYWCLRGEPNLCPAPNDAALSRSRLTWDGRPVVQMASVGSFGEYMLTTQAGVLKIPEDIPPAEAALVGCGVMTGVGAALYTAKVPGGAVVAVIGCGGVGLNVIQGCRIAGASQIIAVDILDNKLEMATNFGATSTINAANVDAVEAVKEATGGDGVEIAFEAIGNVNAARQAWDMVRAGGNRLHRRHDAARLRGQPAGARVPAGEEGDRLHVRQHPLP